jgi:CSLREA domain-containing protein
MKSIRIFPSFVLIIILLALTTGMRPLAPAASINVTIFIDEYNDTSTGCSLREAITAANTDFPYGGCPAGSGADIIQLPAGIYLLTRAGSVEESNVSGDLDITSEMTWVGTGSVTIDAGGDTGLGDRVIENSNSGTLTLNNLTITGGRAPDGSDDAGGGIYNAHSLTLADVIVTGNHAGDGSSGGEGGGIYNYVNTTLIITDSVISNNRAGASSGVSTGGSGGGIYMNSGALLSITNSSITDNVAGAGVSGTGGPGGGIYFYSTSDTIITGSTISGNTAGSSTGTVGGYGGGIYAATHLTLLNSTISGNTSGSSTSGSSRPGSGGGILVYDSALIRYSTIYDNHLGSGANGGYGGGIIRNGGSITLGASIVAGNTVNSTGLYPDCYSPVDVISEDYNLIGHSTGCTLNPSPTHSILDPVSFSLPALGDNGGSTWTHALLPGNPALDQIPEATNGCGTIYATDQRGFTRPVGGACDIGAYEFGNTPPVAVTDSYSTVANTPLSVNAAGGLLANDTDADADPLTAVLVLGPNPAQGLLALSTDGSFTFTPAAGFTGDATFTYAANDGYESSTSALVTIHVVNTKPVAVTDSYSTVVNTPLSVDAAGGLLANDTDADGDPLTAVLVSGPNPAQGSLTLSADGSFTFTPAVDFTGDATFKYAASDGYESSTATLVTIHVTARHLYLPLIKK